MRGIGDSRPKKTESQEWERDLRLGELETLGQKRTRESGMENGLTVRGTGESKQKTESQE